VETIWKKNGEKADSPYLICEKKKERRLVSYTSERDRSPSSGFFIEMRGSCKRRKGVYLNFFFNSRSSPANYMGRRKRVPFFHREKRGRSGSREKPFALVKSGGGEN